MKRNVFLKRIGVGGVIAATGVGLLEACKKEKIDPKECVISPIETAGPFPIKSPTDLVRENIIGNKAGVALKIAVRVQDTNSECSPLTGATVDIWQCDAKGNYSEYNEQLDGNFTNEHFLRGRQTTDAIGEVSFISIYPGWYPGRAPHLHLEVKDANGKSLLITQVAFPEDISKTVYKTSGYKKKFDTRNRRDNEFKNSLERNMADSVTGNVTDGYVLVKTVKVAG